MKEKRNAVLLAVLALMGPAPMATSLGAEDVVTPVSHAVETVEAFGTTLYAYDTKRYRLYTDVDVELARDIALRLDAMYDEYARRLSAFDATDVGRLDVYVFTHRNDYSQFIQDRLPNTGGVFIPSRNVLAAYLEGRGATR